MTQHVAPHTEQFYTVSQMIANLKAAQRTAAEVTAYRAGVNPDPDVLTPEFFAANPHALRPGEPHYMQVRSEAWDAAIAEDVRRSVKAQREKAMPLVRVPTDDLMKRPDPMHNARTGRPVEHAAGFGLLVKPTRKPAIEIGAKVRVEALGICGKLVAVQPSQVQGGVTVYRIGWLEGKAQDYREAGFWLEDISGVEIKSR